MAFSFTPPIGTRPTRGGGRFGWLAVAAALLVTTQPAFAEQRQDFMVAAQEEGTFLFVDTAFPGMQATVEHRMDIYGQANQALFRVNSLLTLPMYESQVDAELRVLLFTLGVSAGFRDVYRTLQFDVDDSLARGARRGRDSDARQSEHLWGFGEFRLDMALPFNEYSVGLVRTALRLEDRPERTFDYRNGVVHDGELWRAEFYLFGKHAEWGAIAPLYQILHFELDGGMQTVTNVGLMAVTRGGLMRRDDLFLFQVMVHPGDILGGEDYSAIYGAQAFYGPWSALVAYRVIFDLSEIEFR